MRPTYTSRRPPTSESDMTTTGDIDSVTDRTVLLSRLGPVTTICLLLNIVTAMLAVSAILLVIVLRVFFDVPLAFGFPSAPMPVTPPVASRTPVAVPVYASPPAPGAICTTGEGYFVVSGVDKIEVQDADGDNIGPMNMYVDTARYWPAKSGERQVRGRNRNVDGGWGPWTSWETCTALPNPRTAPE